MAGQFPSVAWCERCRGSSPTAKPNRFRQFDHRRKTKRIRYRNNLALDACLAGGVLYCPPPLSRY